MDIPALTVLVRGVGDVGSAVAHRLFGEGYAVVIHDGPTPTATRRGMAFADAIFDGRASLEGVKAVRAEDIGRLRALLADRQSIPVCVGAFSQLREQIAADVLVDARMLKHSPPDFQQGLAPFTIALGPDLVAGRHTDVVIETSWNGLGRVIREGASLPLSGEPREIGGHARDRYAYAPVGGMFRTKAQIGDVVRQGQPIAEIDSMVLLAPLDGVLRGLTRDGVPVTVRTKVIEVDPRGVAADVRGIGERPRRIAEGVLVAIREWHRARGG